MVDVKGNIEFMPLKMVRSILEQVGWLASKTDGMGFDEMRVILKEAFDLRRGIMKNQNEIDD
jgi:hypothetical protein